MKFMTSLETHDFMTNI